jgi:hypothetical protein
VDIDTPLAFAMSTIVVLAILFEFFIFKAVLGNRYGFIRF